MTEPTHKATPPTTLQQAEHAIMVWAHVAAAGVPLEAVTAPAYWAHVSKKLAAGHRIEVRAEDGAWWANLIVLASGRMQARVAVLQHVALNDADAPEAPSGFEVKFRGPCKWSVIREADGAVMVEKLASKGDAQDWMAANLFEKAA